ncbi:hypothetical protein CHLRE_13g565260v5 [Chlamydomonas reinhardtii]|uniref:Protein kinase domain-containing protein n=1 Tax=Chlamydomonas reinhardtii TaxID=3055 RepID=A0A2K3CZ76_CHLRE|nr:uncharacterized protein CHLRE_13g565260v5 [Chlamydomonas reinhardtii]PNW73593.1 hypothetical protein CHLRE_13g565260v5 [Chlamydomonas reinhardtii]
MRPTEARATLSPPPATTTTPPASAASGTTSTRPNEPPRAPAMASFSLPSSSSSSSAFSASASTSATAPSPSTGRSRGGDGASGNSGSSGPRLRPTGARGGVAGPAPGAKPAQLRSARAGGAGGFLGLGIGGGGSGKQLGGGNGGFGPDDSGDIIIPEFQEPSAYNAAMNSRYWETRPVRVLGRLVRIGVEFGGWAASCRALNLRLRDTAAQEAAAAEALKDVLVRLGPAFVKIGQALSSRPDVLPPAYIGALEALQDRIPPFPDAAAMAVLEAELGRPPSAVFASLSSSPVAAASLGQVYRGVLRPEVAGGQSGVEVAVKVQRPRVAQMIAQDVYILRILAGWLRTARRFNTDLPALVDEWASSLFRELDYRIEADNARRFKALFSHLPQVYVPHIYEQTTTAKILTMEWIDGERLRTAGTSAAERGATGAPSSTRTFSAPASAAALDARRLEDLALVEVGVRCSLEQMLEEGFYHADPHPGNLLRTPDGRLAYLDFGMMGQIDEKTRNALMTATLHLVNREYGRLAEDFVALGLLPPGTDRESVMPALTGVFSEALQGGVSNLSFGTLSSNLGVTMYKYSFRIPPYYTLLVRSLSVLEGIALAADPNYKVLGSAYPWIARRLLTDPSPDLRIALRRLLYSESTGRFRFDRLESLLRQAAKSATRLKRPAVAPPSAPASASAADGTTSSGPSMPQGGGALLLLLSTDGEFVRGILLDEVAKGIDGACRIAADAALDAVRSSVAALPAPAVPLLALLPGAPLAALGVLGVLAVTRGSSSSGSSSSGSSSSGSGSGSGLDADGALGGAPLSPVAVQAALTSALARLPSLANADDRAQVAGLLQLGNALADVAGLKVPAAVASATAAATGAAAADSSASTSSASTPPPQPPLPAPPSPDELVEAAQQAAAAVRWLAEEAAALPPDARGELLQLPLQLGSRLAGRFTARTLRSLVVATSGSSLPPDALERELMRREEAAADLVPPAAA